VTDLRGVHNPHCFCNLSEVLLAEVLRHASFDRLRFQQLKQALSLDILLDKYPVAFFSSEFSIELREEIGAESLHADDFLGNRLQLDAVAL